MQHEMFDTIAIKRYLARPPTEEHLLSLGWHPRYSRRDGTLCAFILNEQEGSTEPRLTISLNPKKQWHLTAEASLPKLLHGVNVPLLNESEIESSLLLFSASVERRSGLPFEPHSALVCRADAAKDMLIGEDNIFPTITKLQKVQVPRYDRIPCNDTSIVFTPKGKGNSKRISVYGKLAEVISRNGSQEEKRNACGIARLEVELRTKAITYLIEKLKLPSREAQYVLTPEFSDYVIQDSLQKLQFDAIELTANEYIRKLIDCYGVSRAKSLLGFLEIRKQFGENLYKHVELDYPRRTYFRDLADCRNAGVLPLE